MNHELGVLCPQLIEERQQGSISYLQIHWHAPTAHRTVDEHSLVLVEASWRSEREDSLIINETRSSRTCDAPNNSPRARPSQQIALARWWARGPQNAPRHRPRRPARPRPRPARPRGRCQLVPALRLGWLQRRLRGRLRGRLWRGITWIWGTRPGRGRRVPAGEERRRWRRRRRRRVGGLRVRVRALAVRPASRSAPRARRAQRRRGRRRRRRRGGRVRRLLPALVAAPSNKGTLSHARDYFVNSLIPFTLHPRQHVFEFIACDY